MECSSDPVNLSSQVFLKADLKYTAQFSIVYLILKSHYDH